MGAKRKSLSVGLSAVSALVVAGLLAVSSAQAAHLSQGARILRSQDPFSARELSALQTGDSVKRPFSLTLGGKSYHAGYCYRLVRGTPMNVIRALRRPGGLVQAIPYALSITTVSETDGKGRMRIVQGKGPVTGSYTVTTTWDLHDYRASFWMDPSERSDLEDIWGVFSARQIRPGWTLVSFGFSFKIGGLGSLLEDKAQQWALTTADRVADLLAEE